MSVIPKDLGPNEARQVTLRGLRELKKLVRSGTTSRSQKGIVERSSAFAMKNNET